MNTFEPTIRPLIDLARCQLCGQCLQVCPGIEISHRDFSSGAISRLRRSWGPVLKVWQGYATDPEIRFKASSGGIATALSLFCLERKGSTGVLHIGADSKTPLKNIPVFSTSREQLLAHAGSRYSPAAPCQRFDWIKEADAPCVFIGKPCDIAALSKAQIMDPLLDGNVALTIGIFCAGTPGNKGTRVLLRAFGVQPDDVAELTYRGWGWPGMATVKLKAANGPDRKMTYEHSWGVILSRHVMLRCRLCPDSTAEFADISCGDLWAGLAGPSDPGRSLVLVRTQKGAEILKEAMKAHYLDLTPAALHSLAASQPALLNKRRQVWGRLLAMRIMRLPTPRFRGFSLFTNWCRLPASDKLRSVLGALRRIISRKWGKAQCKA